MREQHVENLIVGAGLVGALTARVLARHGRRGLLVERNADPGGVNGSFEDGLGNRFDYGRHVISDDRSDFTTRLVEEVLDGRVRRFDLRRGVVVRGHLIPYAAELGEWPSPLRERIRLDIAARVGLGSTRAEFARAYGQWFADLAFDEMLAAYPVLRWHRERGVPEERLMRWIFPWFFPRSGAEAPPRAGAERGVYSEESRRYHYDRRHSDPPRETVLYPEEGGFGGLIESMLDDGREGFDLRLGASDIEIDIDPASLTVRGVSADGVRYRPERVFWCAPLPVLCRYLDWSLPEGQPQWELLGSFTFDRPVAGDYHEILFADPEYPLRRLNFPGLIAGETRSRTVQAEYTTLGDEAHGDAGEWRDRWLRSLRRLGLVDEGREPAFFDLKRVSRGVISNQDLGGFLADCENRIRESGGNLVAPHLAVASDNNARLIPKVVKAVEAALA